jgi:DNA-binding GntR family transcriptional regulator
VADLRKVMKLNRHHSLFKTGRVSESLKEHAAIMTALRSGDALGAAAAMRHHMLQGLEAAV